MGFKNKKFDNLINGISSTVATQLGDTHCWYVTYHFTTVDGEPCTAYDLWSYRTYLAHIIVSGKNVNIERSVYWDTWRYTPSVTTKKHYRRFMNEIVGYGKEEQLASYYIDTCTSEYDPTKHKPYMNEQIGAIW